MPGRVVDDSLALSRSRAGAIRWSSRRCARQAAEAFVANDCDLSPAEAARNGAIWLLTGPNMGGKSTFLRQNALIADPGADRLLRSGRRARISAWSTGCSAASALPTISRAAARPSWSRWSRRRRSSTRPAERSLVILDEIGRGTATFDGLSIAWAAVEYLHEKNRCRAIFATHFHEMTALVGKAAAARATSRCGSRNGTATSSSCTRSPRARPTAPTASRSPASPACRTPSCNAPGTCCTSSKPARRPARPTAWSTICRCSAPRCGARRRSPRRPIALGEALAAINPDEMTPREALEALYRLKGLAQR